MDFPSEPPQAYEAAKAASVTSVLVEALSLTSTDDVLFVGENRMDMLVELSRGSFDALRAPKFALLKGFDKRAVCVTSRGKEDETYCPSLSLCLLCCVTIQLV